jgi:hypothetical protein
MTVDVPFEEYSKHIEYFSEVALPRLISECTDAGRFSREKVEALA